MSGTEHTAEVGGAKVTINPSDQLIKAAAKEVAVTDDLGRSIRLKKPGVLAQYRLIEALGSTAKNEVYMGMVLPLIFVSAIDEEAVAPPMSKGEVEALIKRLDEEGIAAVLTGVQANFGGGDQEEIRKKSEA